MSLLLGKAGRVVLRFAAHNQWVSQKTFAVMRFMHNNVSGRITPGLTTQSYLLWEKCRHTDKIAIKQDGFYNGEDYICGNAYLSQALLRNGSTLLDLNIDKSDFTPEYISASLSKQIGIKNIELISGYLDWFSIVSFSCYVLGLPMSILLFTSKATASNFLFGEGPIKTSIVLTAGLLAQQLLISRSMPYLWHRFYSNQKDPGSQKLAKELASIDSFGTTTAYLWHKAIVSVKEEFFFRVIFLSSFIENPDKPRALSVLFCSSLLFSVGHENKDLGAFYYRSLKGLLLGAGYYFSGGAFIVPVTLHFMHYVFLLVKKKKPAVD